MKRILPVLSLLILFSLPISASDWSMPHRTPQNLRYISQRGSISIPGFKWNKSVGRITTDILSDDIDADGSPEMIFASDNILIAMKNGKILWRKPLGASMDRIRTPSIYDIRGSTGREILVGTGTSIYLLDSSGKIIWQDVMDETINNPPRYLEKEENYFLTEGDNPVLLDSQRNIIAEKNFEARQFGFADIDSDPEAEILAGTMGIRAMESSDLSSIWKTDIRIFSQPLIDDVNLDGSPDIVFRSSGSEIVALNSKGKSIWKTEIESDVPDIHSPVPSAGDLDGDGTKEVVASGYTDKKLYIIEGNSGEIVETFEVSGRPSDPTLIDIDSDGILEVIVSTIAGYHVYAFEYDSLDWTLRSKEIINTAPTPLDFDGDNKLELAVGTERGIIIIGNKENTPPEALFEVSKSSAFTGQNITFDSSSSSDKEDIDSKLRYRWDFQNDGVFDTSWKEKEEFKRYYYQSSGNFTVLMEVKDSFDLKDDFTREIRIFGSNKPPEADFVMSRDSGSTGSIVRFTARPSDRESSPEELEVKWDFQNDGIWDTNLSHEKETTYVYDKEGNYKIKMLVKDPQSAKDTIKKSIRIESSEESSKEASGDNNGLSWLIIVFMVIFLISILVILVMRTKRASSEERKEYRRERRRY